MKKNVIYKTFRVDFAPDATTCMEVGSTHNPHTYLDSRYVACTLTRKHAHIVYYYTDREMILKSYMGGLLLLKSCLWAKKYAHHLDSVDIK